MQISVEQISATDDDAIGAIIKLVGAEFGAIGEGFGPSDPEVVAMSQNYGEELSSRYYVAKVNGELVGGGGVAPFNQSAEICELKKLFILPSARGMGIGSRLTSRCLEYARSKGFSKCYLDTLSTMQAAVALYEQFGFVRLDKPLAGTIHSRCDVWMLKSL